MELNYTYFLTKFHKYILEKYRHLNNKNTIIFKERNKNIKALYSKIKAFEGLTGI